MVSIFLASHAERIQLFYVDFFGPDLSDESAEPHDNNPVTDLK
jgi:hypothetical protein